MDNTLKELRGEAGWSQAQMGNRLSVSRQTIIAIENGKYDPSLPLAFSIAALFNQKIEDIFKPET
jgi:putative transcriptional regulator